MQGEAAAGSAAGIPAVDNGFAMGICRDGCPDKTASEFMYSDSVKGGEFVEGAEIVFGTCGTDPDVAAEIEQCPDNIQGQWELLPMFALEAGKEAINCAPYSHTMATPDFAGTRQ